MSQYRGNAESCAHCGLTYGRFRTGLSYRDVWLMFYTPPDAPSDEWKYKTRGVVLGKWFEIKQELWQKHLEDCQSFAIHKRRKRNKKRACSSKSKGKRRANVAAFRD